MSLFTHTLEGMQQNNEHNNAQFAHFPDAYTAIEVYSTSFKEDIDDIDSYEMNATVEALDSIISCGSDDIDGSIIQKIISDWSEAVWGADGE